MPDEREIKLPVTESFVLPDLDSVVTGVTAVDRGTLRLDATYWDGPDLELLRAGLGMRHRAAEGEPGRWTIKAGARFEGPAVIRAETDYAGPPQTPPDAVMHAVRASVGTIRLRPVARLITLRQTVDLTDGRGERRAEVADDHVTVLSDHGVAVAFREVEVELFDADAALVDAVLARLRAAGAGEPDPTPKYIRALRALGHDVPPGPPS